ncbi:hypothetical protein SISSUDRAFT_1047483 [Sistotremastrum suecicum HHB10207 ss-3]|uniref:Uncharacterized protein n=1 Tax=Sistotremastrum suecicum HHB10207 ss-3 TaxID=1314776 RepID=A0A166D4B8_9AGAM|nr:hypothetical protein SISSUDRAFT_1047483 [Sistotremastrum suecicum HHB10207 ss-3]
MADSEIVTPPAGDGITWVQGISANGNIFFYGTKNGPKQTNVDATDAMSLSSAKKYQVYWRVGDNQTWHSTSGAVRDTVGISRWKLFKGFNGSQVGDYCLEFTNTKGWGFTFEDETGDKYEISTVVNRTHILRYNSSRPNIVYVW